MDNGSCTYADPNAAVKNKIKEQYANIAFANYQDSYNLAVVLRDAIYDFVNAPDAAKFQTAKDAWIDSREPYGQSEAFRFADGPIDDANGPEGNLNAWPLDESHIDYVISGTGADENAGNIQNIINNPTDYPTIDQSTLAGLNENGSEKNISIGYHGIEFLLWGQDLDAMGNPQYPMAGQRAYTDYVTGGSGTNSNQDRRGQYIKVCADILVDDLAYVVNAWDPSVASNYRSTWMAMDNDLAMQKIFTACAIFSKSELGGERVSVALQNADQEDEHSCFSDNTHRDVILNMQGVYNLYHGTYSRTNGIIISGSGLRDLIFDASPNDLVVLDAAMDDAILKTNNIPIPFDEGLTLELFGGSGPIMLSYESLVAVGDGLVSSAANLGYSISAALPSP
jgi:putative iron-regulated protein